MANPGEKNEEVAYRWAKKGGPEKEGGKDLLA